GTGEEDLRKAIASGMNIVHINTELRLAWRRGLESSLTNQPNDLAPYKILPSALKAVKSVVRGRLLLFRTEQLNDPLLASVPRQREPRITREHYTGVAQ